MLHLSDKMNEFKDEMNLCRYIIKNAIDGNNFYDELSYLASYIWEKVNNKAVIFSMKADDADIIEDKIEFVILKISTAIELLRYEPFYESVNYSTAIGQLALSNMHLYHIDEKLSKELRQIINSDYINLDKLNEFRSKLL